MSDQLPCSVMNYALILLCCFLSGCLGKYSDPAWDSAEVHSMLKGTKNTAGTSWQQIDEPIVEGVEVSSGRKGAGGCISLVELQQTNRVMSIYLSVSVFKVAAYSEQYYAVLRQVDTIPISQEGTVDGYQYVFTKSLRPRNDPAGGGFLQNRRLTYLTLRKGRTVAVAEIHTRGSELEVDMNKVFIAVNTAVDEW